MKLEIRRYNDELKDDWEKLVTHSVNGTFLHSRAFFDHNPLNKDDDHSFLFYKKNKVVGVVPFCLYTKDGRLVLHSHLRATYGGFVVNAEIGTEEALEMVELLVAEAKDAGVKEIIIRNPFRIFHKDLCEETDYAMWYHGFALKARELEIAIDLKGNIADIRKRYENGTKYNVKKAVKTVSCRISEDYSDFWAILENNLAEKHDRKPVHSLDTFLQLLNNVGSGKIKLFAGYVDGVMACGCIIFVFNKAIHAQYIGSDNAYQDIRPVNALIDHIIEWANREQFEFFNQGTANTENGRAVNYGLFHFKESFGGRGTLRETMSLNVQ